MTLHNGSRVGRGRVVVIAAVICAIAGVLIALVRFGNVQYPPGGFLGFTFTPSAAGLAFAVVLLVILFGTVFAAVHHAEVIAERVGEPYGTLLLTLAVTIIEVALIATIMLGDKPVPASINPVAMLLLTS